MNCNEFENSIEAYNSGLLNEHHRAEMKMHLDVCSSCARLLRAERLVSDALDTAESVAAPSHLMERIIAATPDLPASDAVVDSIRESMKVKGIDCREFELHAAAYVDGCADDSLSLRMNEHCAACTACARLLEAYRLVRSAFEAVEPIPAPAGFANAVLEAVAHEQEQTQLTTENKITFPDLGELAVGAAVAALVAVRFLVKTGILSRRFPEFYTWIEEITVMLNQSGGMTGGSEGGEIWTRLNVIIESWGETISGLAARLPDVFSYPVPLPFIAQDVPVFLLAAVTAGIVYVWVYLDQTGLVPEPRTSHLRH